MNIADGQEHVILDRPKQQWDESGRGDVAVAHEEGKNDCRDGASQCHKNDGEDSKKGCRPLAHEWDDPEICRQGGIEERSECVKDSFWSLIGMDQRHAGKRDGEG